jgi:hypothetical protein
MKCLIKALNGYLPYFAIIEKGGDEQGNDRYVTYQVEKGAFRGMACTPQPPADWTELEGMITPYPENEFIRSTIFSAVARGVGYILKPEDPEETLP